MLKKYAALLSDYSIDAQAGQRVLIKSSYLAEPLLQELYTHLLQKGCFVEFDLSFNDERYIYSTPLVLRKYFM